MLHTIITEGLTDRQYVDGFTEGFADAGRAHRRLLARGDGAGLRHAGRDAPRGRADATRARKASIIFWGMGISQHVHGTDNARCLIALALVTGQVGAARHRAASAARPEQRAGRLGRRPDPDVLPRLSAGRAADRRTTSSRQIWGTPLDPKRGLTVVEIMNAIHAGQIEGMYIMGENPAMSDPDVHHARQALAKLEAPRGAGHLPDRDGLARRRGPAGLGLPGEDRHLHQHRPPGPARPHRRCRCRARRGSISRSSRSSPTGWAATGTTPDVGDVFTEMAETMPSLKNISWERLEREGAVTYPGDGPDKPGQRDHLRRRLPDPERPRQDRAGQHPAARRGARRRSIPMCSRPAACSSTGTPAR